MINLGRFTKGHKVSEEIRKKIGDANRNQRAFKCDYCGNDSSDKPSSYAKKKKHFCSAKCYSEYRKNILPKEGQNACGHGLSEGEREIRKKARTILNHAIRDGKITRRPCELCGNEAEAHHDDYSKPLEVKWFCFNHHRRYHRENPELVAK